MVERRGKVSVEFKGHHRDLVTEADRLAEEVDSEIDVGEHPLLRRDAHGDAVGRVHEADEVGRRRAGLAVDEGVWAADPRAGPAGAALGAASGTQASGAASPSRPGEPASAGDGAGVSGSFWWRFFQFMALFRLQTVCRRVRRFAAGPAAERRATLGAALTP